MLILQGAIAFVTEITGTSPAEFKTLILVQLPASIFASRLIGLLGTASIERRVRVFQRKSSQYSEIQAFLCCKEFCTLLNSTVTGFCNEVGLNSTKNMKLNNS